MAALSAVLPATTTSAQVPPVVPGLLCEHFSAPGCSAWAVTEPGPPGADGPDDPVEVATSSDGSLVFVAGTARVSEWAIGAMTLALDAATGERAWVDTYVGPSGGSATGHAVLTDDAMVLVAATGNGTSSRDAAATLIAYGHDTGDRRWVQRYEGEVPGATSVRSTAEAAVLDPDTGLVFTAGRMQGYVGTSGMYEQAFLTIAWDSATGEVVWDSTFLEEGSRVGCCRQQIALSGDGSVVYVAGTRAAPTPTEQVVVAYDASTGELLWSAKTGQRWPAESLVVDAERVYVASNWSHVEALDAQDGTAVWSKRLNGYTAGMALDPVNATLVTISSRAGVGRWTWLTRAMHASNGSTAWEATYSTNPLHASTRTEAADKPRALVVDPDGEAVYVTGIAESRQAGGGWSTDWMTIRYEAAIGLQEWARRYDGPGGGSEDPTAITLGPDGSSLFVAGQVTDDAQTTRYGAVAYPTGQIGL